MKNITRLSLFVVFLICLSFPAISRSQTSPPHLINLQAVLVDEGGNVLYNQQEADIIFSIVDGAGETFYEEEQHVVLVNGAISVLVGQGIDLSTGGATGGIPLEALEPEGTKLLRVKLKDQSIPQEDLELATVPYAMYADKAYSLVEPLESEGILDGTIAQVDLSPALLEFINNSVAGVSQADLIAHKAEENAHNAETIFVRNAFINASGNDLQTVLEGLDRSIGTRRNEEGVLGDAIDTETTAREVAVTAEAATRTEEDVRVLESEISRAGDTVYGDLTFYSDETLSTETMSIEPSTGNMSFDGELSLLNGLVTIERDESTSEPVLSLDDTDGVERLRLDGDTGLMTIDGSMSITGTVDGVDVSGEQVARIASDEAESEARTAADAAETAAREAAVSAEAATRAAAVATEAASRAAADASEATTREAADTAERAARESADVAETSAREVADTAEVTARSDGDAAEQTAREARDTILQTNLDTETADRILDMSDEEALRVATDTTILQAMPPVGTIIPFYDYGGALTFNPQYWAYCDGSTVTIPGLGTVTLPDLSNRYLVGFGSEGGGDIGSATWDTAVIGNPSHQVNLEHSHTVEAHTHTTPNHSHSLSDHTHGMKNHTHGMDHSHSLSGHTHSSAAHNHTIDPHNHRWMYSGQLTWTDSGVQVWNEGGGYHSPGDDGNNDTPYPNFYTETSGPTSTGETTPGSTGGPSTDSTGGSSSANTGAPSDNITDGSSISDTGAPSNNSTDTSGSGVTGSASPSTNRELLVAQSIQPRSVRVRFIMRIQ